MPVSRAKAESSLRRFGRDRRQRTFRCHHIRQNDEMFCSTCKRRWPVVEPNPPCEERDT